jgi:dimethylhistidine N-methyltransferase
MTGILAIPTESRLTFVDGDRGLRSDFASDVRAGLSARRKRLCCRYLYDAAGSQLFERICELPEYYPTRTELAILQANAPDLARACDGLAALVELGSGSARKTRTLIDALVRRYGTLHYLPLDISRSMLDESSRALLTEFPTLRITAIAAEYGHGLQLLRGHRQPKLIAWLGSNVGNFGRGEAARFLARVRGTMAPRDRLLIGIDLRKPRALLEAAYDDAAGVTARFNLNLLERINRELLGRFDLGAFAHRALWNRRHGRVEMHLVSRTRQTVRIDGLALEVSFRRGETIFTESSYKYSLEEIRDLARAAGLAVERCWLDEQQWFSVSLLAPLSG